MGTRSAIGVKLADGSVKAVYCHWDGYPEYNGKILWNHYSEEDKIMQLIKLGDLSSLGEEIGTKHKFEDAPFGQCTFYGRDRGEKNVNARKFRDEEEFRNTFDCGAEYWYLYNDGNWYVQSYNDADWELVSRVLDKEIEHA